MNKVFVFFLLIFFIGCSTHKAVNVSKPKPLPSWYLNPIKSYNGIVYVSGSGIDKKHAILDALSNFISRYSITISSKFENSVKSFGGGLYSKKSREDIKATIKQFEISNYEVVKATQYSFDKFFVLIKVDTNKLYRNLKSKLDDRFENYKNEYNLILKENLLKQYVDLKKLYEKLKKEKNYVFILKLMNKNFDEKKYLSFINRVKNRWMYVKKHLYLEVDSNNKEIAEDIKKYLLSQGIKVGKSDIKLKVNVVKKNSSLMNLKIYRIYLNLEYKNSIIGNNFFKIIIPKSSSVEGYLFSNINKLPLEKVLNLK